MTDKKIVAVLGATGAQGGGLVRAILDDPQGGFAARAITRNPDSAKARELAARGAEVVRADLDDEASLRAAFGGAYGAFVVTNFSEPLTAEQESARPRWRMELEQAGNAARAAKEATLRHVVWSTLEDTRPHFAHLGSDAPALDGGYQVPHFDAKAQANGDFTALGVPTTFLETTINYESLLMGFGPRRDADGRLVVWLPMGDSPVSYVAADDVGRTAYAIFAGGAKFISRTVGLAGAHVTGEELAGLLAKVLDEPVIYRPMTPDEVRVSGWPLAEEVAGMFQFFTEASENRLAHRDLEQIRALNPRLQPFEDWMIEHREQLKAAVPPR